jgi:thiol-disulfide isomerase/thioredoxin
VRSSRLAPVFLVLLGCSRSDAPPKKDPSPPASASVASVVTPSGPLVLARGVRIVAAGPGDDAATVIRAERDRASADGRDVVVYVGAKWCEPCQRFHAAVERGELDADFPTLSLIAFDLDVDKERLVSAGYVSELIPLFVIPGADGRATSKRFEGSVKGDRAVANIAPRLRQILAR